MKLTWKLCVESSFCSLFPIPVPVPWLLTRNIPVVNRGDSRRAAWRPERRTKGCRLERRGLTRINANWGAATGSSSSSSSSFPRPPSSSPLMVHPSSAFPPPPLSVLSMRARSRNFHAQNAQIDTLFPIQEPSRLFKSRLTSRVVRFTETRRRGGGGASLSILLHPRILLSLRRNQFGISVNRPLSPEEYSVSRFTVKSRSDYIGDAERGTNFYTVEGIPKRVYIYIYTHSSSFIFLFLADRLPCHHRFHYLERKEGRKEEQRFPSRVRTMNRITRFDTWYIRMFPLYLPRHSSLPLFCPRVTGPSRIGIAKTPTRPIDNP